MLSCLSLTNVLAFLLPATYFAYIDKQEKPLQFAEAFLVSSRIKTAMIHSTPLLNVGAI